MSSGNNGDSSPNSGNSEKAPRRNTAGKGHSGSRGSGSRNKEEYENMEASDSAAEEAQAQLNDIKEDIEADAEELLNELDEIQQEGPNISEASESTAGEGLQGGATGGSGGPSSRSSSVQNEGSNSTSRWEDTPSRSEFASQVFTDRAVADSQSSNLEEAAEPNHTNRFGDFDQYSPAKVEDWEPIKGAPGEGRGFTDHAKDRGIVAQETDLDTPMVYRTKYGKADGRLDRDNLKTNQMALSTFTRAMGVESPRMTYDSDRNEVVAESVSKSQTDTTQPIHRITDSDIANKVDRQEYIDKFAVQTLGGNWDTSSDNIQISEDGTVHTFDYDRGDRKVRDFRSLQEVATRAAESADKLDKVRDDNNQLDISNKEIAERAAEIAYELESSGYDTEVIDAVEAQMQAMSEDPNTDSSECTNHEIYRTNIEVAADAARDRFGWN